MDENTRLNFTSTIDIYRTPGWFSGIPFNYASRSIQVIGLYRATFWG